MNAWKQNENNDKETSGCYYNSSGNTVSLVRSLVKSKTLVKSCMHSSINNGTMCDTHGLVPKEIKFLLRGHWVQKVFFFSLYIANVNVLVLLFQRSFSVQVNLADSLISFFFCFCFFREFTCKKNINYKICF